MLDSLRKGAKSWVAKILILLLIASFAVWGIGDIFSFRLESMIARVGQTEVSAERFANAMNRQRNLISRQQGQLVPYDTLRAANVDGMVLAGLMRDAAFAEELSTLGIAIPPEAVRDTISTNPEFLDGQGGFSQFTYQTRLANAGFETYEFEDLTRTLLGQQILRDVLEPGMVSPPGISEKVAGYRGESRGITVLSLPLELGTDPGEPGEEALEAHFSANESAFVEPERRAGEFLHVDVAAMADTMAPSEDEARAYYDENQERYSVESARTVEQIVFEDRTAAEAALTRLTEETATFADIAAEEGVAASDLSLGTVRQGDLAPETDEAVFALSDPGIAGPVTTPFGHALLNVIAVQEGGAAPFEDVASAIQIVLARERALDRAPEIANQIEDLRAANAGLDEIATETGLTLGLFDGLARDGSSNGSSRPAIADNPEFLDEVFDALDGEERDMIPLENGGFLLVNVIEIVESHLPDLGDIRGRVVEAWQREKKLQSLDERAEQLAKRAAGGVELAEIATELGQVTRDLPAFTRSSPPPELTPDLVTSIFEGEKDAVVHGRGAGNDSVNLIRVGEIVPLDDERRTSDTEQIETALNQSLARDTFEYFGRAIEARHGTVVDETALEEVFGYLGQSTTPR